MDIILQFSVTTEILWTLCFLLSAVGWRGELKDQKVKNMGCDRKSLLETATK